MARICLASCVISWLTPVWCRKWTHIVVLWWVFVTGSPRVSFPLVMVPFNTLVKTNNLTSSLEDHSHASSHGYPRNGSVWMRWALKKARRWDISHNCSDGWRCGSGEYLLSLSKALGSTLSTKKYRLMASSFFVAGTNYALDHFCFIEICNVPNVPKLQVTKLGKICPKVTFSLRVELRF